MYNDKNRQTPEVIRQGRDVRAPIGRSCPSFSDTNYGRNKIPNVDERIGRRLCDGSLPPEDNGRGEMNGCGNPDGGWGISARPLAMVYAPLQEFHELYDPEVALERGTLFAQLDLPFEGGKGKKGGCCL